MRGANRGRAQRAPISRPYLREVSLKRDRQLPANAYPFCISSIRNLGTLTFDPNITFLIGDNGAGKSTLLEAIAVALGLNPEGGSRHFRFSSRDSHSSLWQYLRLVRSWSRPRDQYFLRAESFFNVATEIEALDREPSHSDAIIGAYGGQSLHEQSHGEGFFALLMNRFRGNGLYLLDEPEAALSPARQLLMLRRMRDLVMLESQFIVATHSPILLAYPNALILTLDQDGYRKTDYKDSAPYLTMKMFIDNPEAAVKHAFETDYRSGSSLGSDITVESD